MKKISVKLIVIAFLVMVVSSLIPNLIWRIFGEGNPHTANVNPLWILLTASFTVFVTIVLYSLFVNHLVVKRLTRLNIATKDVIEGHYDSHIVDHQHDELAELASSFNDMTNALKHNEYVNKSFVRNFSHELKTPLATIKGYAELLEDANLTTEERQYLKIVLDESSRLSYLSQNMLLISHIDHQVIVPKKDTYNMTEQLRQVIQRKQRAFEQRGLMFDLDVEEVTVLSNQDLTYQVFTNVIDNAITYSEVNKTIFISVIKKEHHIVITIENSVQDNAIDTNHIFDLFYTEDKQYNTQNGIGLTLVKKIMDKLGGTVFAELNNKQFRLTLTHPIKQK